MKNIYAVRTLTLIPIFMVLIALAACQSDTDETDGDDVRREFTTEVTDSLEIDFEYGEAFIAEGYGRVELASCEDGDTAEFLTEGQQIRVRFLGIDTPEASGVYEPWGYHATEYACNRLLEAEEIVLEMDPSTGPTDTFNRYLAFIWVDGKLLNVELVEQGFAEIRSYSDLKYADAFVEAFNNARAVGERVHEAEGTDPLWDYSTTPEAVTLQVLVENPEEYWFRYITVEGVVTKQLGTHAFIEQDGFGVFVFLGHESSTWKFDVGNHIRLEGVRWINDLERRNGWHITHFPPNAIRNNVDVLEEEISVEPETITLDLLSDSFLGRFVRLENMTVIDRFYEDDWVLLVETLEGETIEVRRSHMIDLDYYQFDLESYQVGDVLNLQGIYSDHINGKHLLVIDEEDVVKVP